MAATAMESQARAILRGMLGENAGFRDGQLEAILQVAERRGKALVVQRTGWGKSIVYFLATRLLRDAGAGPTLLISPLLSLMRNQLEMARRIGVRAATINSANADEWDSAVSAVRRDRCDVLLVAPERLANARFVTDVLPLFRKGVGLFVVDEAHCISDWGHDFRPDYRRIVRIVRALPPRTPILATTATANQRVIDDIVEQLGSDLAVLRGPLARASLRLQTIRLDDQAERLAWLAEYLPDMPGSGIIYCLTQADCERVATWLSGEGIPVRAYHAGLVSDDRVALEEALVENKLKALAATVALGMGFDKPDLGFVVHFQRPGSLVAYYQQIGRAGRGVEQAYAVLLSGKEDDDIVEYFINSAFPPAEQLEAVLAELEKEESLTARDLAARINMPYQRIEQALKMLEIDGAVGRERQRCFRTANPWRPDPERSDAITRRRREELERMKRFVDSTGCLMEFIGRELDDPYAEPCGRCAVCAGPAFPNRAMAATVADAIAFLRKADLRIEPRIQWPSPENGSLNIDAALRSLEGRALSIYGDAGWGGEVASGKHERGRFSTDLVRASVDLIAKRWKPVPQPEWLTCVPSRRHPTLVPHFARRLAKALGIPFRAALRSTRDIEQQKLMENSAQQLANVQDAFEAIPEEVLAGPVILVDDIVNSRWTLTLCGIALRGAGAGSVRPFALATTQGGRRLP